MENEYKYETFGSDASSFDQDFTNYLNRQRSESWKVKHCSYCHDGDAKKLFASCIFKRHH
jgi:hypothetical protein